MTNSKSWSSFPFIPPPIFTSESTTSNKNGGGNEWKTRPTFGIGHEVPVPLVDCGFKFDDTCYDITDNWHTDFEKININVGETHTFELKTYAPKEIKLIELSLGVPEVGKAYMAELKIPVTIDYKGNYVDLEVIGDVDSIEHLEITFNDSLCQPTDDKPKCFTIQYTMRFLEPFENKVISMQAIDHKNRSQTTYLNTGFEILGDSLNPMDIQSIMGTEKYEGLIPVTQKEKFSNIWIAEDGREFERNSFGSFTQINQTFEKSLTTPYKSVMTRLHSNFPDMIIYEQERAVFIFDSSKLISELGESWTFDDAPKTDAEKQAELENRLAEEIDRLLPFTKDYTKNQHLYQKDSYNYWNYFGDMSIAEINQLDLDKKLQLQDEMLQQRLVDKEQYSN